MNLLEGQGHKDMDVTPLTILSLVSRTVPGGQMILSKLLLYEYTYYPEYPKADMVQVKSKDTYFLN